MSKIRTLLLDAADQLEAEQASVARLLADAQAAQIVAVQQQTQADETTKDVERALVKLSAAQDLVALSDSINARQQSVKDLELTQKRKAIDLAKWENKLFDIQARQDAKDKELASRETAVAIKEREYKETAREEIVSSLVKNLTK